MTKNIIKIITLIENQLCINFTADWFQESIDELSHIILLKIPNHQVKEKILGADRENIRFSWQNHEFLLNFECYSQSCWISAYDQASQQMLPMLKNVLERHRNAG